MENLVHCKICKKEVSRTALTCPHCGESNPGLSIKCPKCSSTEVRTGEKGVSVGKAIAGGILLGPLGLFAGASGRKDLVYICNNCKHEWAIK